MADLPSLIDEAARGLGLSGVVRLDMGGRTAVERAYGLAHRALSVPNRPDTQFAIASGSKGFTALAVTSLVDNGVLSLATTARSILGRDLPLIDDRVTVHHLLVHRSGIGDYLDEEVPHQPDDYVMSVSAHELSTTEQFLRVLDGHPQKFLPGERFSYSNGGYVVLALLAERASGMGFHELVSQRVLTPAGMADTSFLRADELPARAALGYLDGVGPRTNVFHLPVRGNGDGGAYTTAGDMHRFWNALFAGSILPSERVEQMLTPSTIATSEGVAYGLGFWLHESADAVELHGFDAGVGFVSVRHREARWTFTVVVNTSRGAWPMRQRLLELVRQPSDEM